jgi:hypothetical protein
VLGVKVAASTVWEILKDVGIGPAPERTCSAWAVFQCSRADAIIARDFFETTMLSGAKLNVLAVIEYATGRIRIFGVTAYPAAVWVTQTARNLAVDLEETGCQVEDLIRDRTASTRPCSTPSSPTPESASCSAASGYPG